ncbi:hypothetical protein [Commensalibacter oyaizuii]|uniref:Uncharacterized protein n=1 Tax=Commensalibacter oyaizuii TaxID=3043873 RepID=A0ABT6Q2L0_9PROT|nr:hypothetical protein [Commensalibacter sp. TBRC 16381]MDI2091329.1 hypothetical protein [Commensalibacter sp. TBRC 16381]
MPLNKVIFDNNIRYELQNTDDGKAQIEVQGMRSKNNELAGYINKANKV